MNEQQIKILIELLEKVEKRQKEQGDKLSEIEISIGGFYRNSPLKTDNNSNTKISFDPLFDKMDINSNKIINHINSYLYKKNNTQENNGFKYKKWLFGTIFSIIAIGLFCILYLKPQVEKKAKEQTITEIVEFYVIKNKKEKLSIDSISKQLRPREYDSFMKNIKRK